MLRYLGTDTACCRAPPDAIDAQGEPLAKTQAQVCVRFGGGGGGEGLRAPTGTSLSSPPQLVPR